MRLATTLLLLSVGAAPLLADDVALRYWPPNERAAHLELEAALYDVASAERLAEWHARLTEEPHRAGTPADARMVRYLAESMAAMGLEVEVHPFTAYLAEPVSARLEIVAAPSGPDPAGGAFGDPAATVPPLALPLIEEPLEEDPFSDHPELELAWNAYSGSGDVSSGVIYAHYGTKEDFERLRELGVEVEGQVVLARYGRNYRGHKATFAQRAGAAGLILYTDPADAGYVRGLPYPEGGWANHSYVQRGSILDLPWAGDPLTPFEPATAETARLDPSEIALPAIPVQPVGWGAAWEIVRRMRGRAVPPEWQGGLPTTYRLEGGPGLAVRLAVEQRRGLYDSANVVARLPGAERPDELVVVGAHFDAWAFGAVDPHAGSMLVLEAARSFVEAARRGLRPRRSVAFAHWGAEEYGIIGSTEWVEAHREELAASAVAYVNLDSAATGSRFGASASPVLKRVIEDAARAVEHPEERYPTVFDQWTAEGGAEPAFGNLGGGSDHVAFYCHLGIPSCGLSAGGSPGVSYHSNYDDLTWYQKVVGADYGPALMLTRVIDVLAARLANAPLLPLDPLRYARDTREHLDLLAERAEEIRSGADLGEVRAAADRYEAVAEPIYDRLLTAVDEDLLDAGRYAALNRLLLGIERVWLHPEGLPERPWFRNLFAATDPDSGYAAWMLPGLRWAVERKRAREIEAQAALYVAAFRELADRMLEIERIVEGR